jgi:hypothetical protein
MEPVEGARSLFGDLNDQVNAQSKKIAEARGRVVEQVHTASCRPSTQHTLSQPLTLSLFSHRSRSRSHAHTVSTTLAAVVCVVGQPP